MCYSAAVTGFRRQEKPYPARGRSRPQRADPPGLVAGRDRCRMVLGVGIGPSLVEVVCVGGLVRGDITRANWVVPVQALTRGNPEGIVRLVACRDGSVTLHVSCAGTRGTVRLEVSRAAQLSTRIWEAAGISQRFIAHLDDDPPAGPRMPPRPARSGKPAGSLWSAPPPGPTAPRRSPVGMGRRPAVVNEGVVMEGEQARTVGWRLHRIRTDRGKSLRVIAGLAGMSKSTLHEIEHGQRAVSLSEIRALATALEVARSELTSLPVLAPANGHIDSATDAVRLALDAIDAEHPEGLGDTPRSCGST